MNTRKSFAVSAVVIFLAVTIQPAYSLLCYQCDSQFQEWCNDPFDKSTHEIALMECLGLGEVCTKLKNSTKVLRMCYEEGYCKLPSIGKFTECIECKKNGCNVSPGFRPVSLNSAILLVVASTIVVMNM